MSDRTCTLPGCRKPYRARGMCSTHYNRTYQPDRHSPRWVACTVCGSPVARPVKADRRHVCSIECRRVLIGATGPGKTWVADAMDRARKAGATVVHPVDRIDVFERDGWRCMICGCGLSLTTDPFAPAAPTVDHVVPLSRGGEHTMANVQAACLHCNSAKQAA